MASELGLLDGGIAKIVDTALTPLMLTAVYHQVGRAADGAGGFEETETDVACKAFVQEFSDFTILTGGAQIGDYQVTAIQNQLAVTPKRGDRITIQAQKYKIIEIEEDPASATWEFKARIYA